jgi:hypothetical protein
MDTSPQTIIYRKSDLRLVNKALGSFIIIAVLGLVIAGLYIITPPQTRVLGTQTSSESGK